MFKHASSNCRKTSLARWFPITHANGNNWDVLCHCHEEGHSVWRWDQSWDDYSISGPTHLTDFSIWVMETLPQMPSSLTLTVKSFTEGDILWLCGLCDLLSPCSQTDPHRLPPPNLWPPPLPATLTESNHTYLRSQNLIRTSSHHQNKSDTVLSSGCVPRIQTTAWVHYLSA